MNQPPCPAQRGSGCLAAQPGHPKNSHSRKNQEPSSQAEATPPTGSQGLVGARLHDAWGCQEQPAGHLLCSPSKCQGLAVSKSAREQKGWGRCSGTKTPTLGISRKEWAAAGDTGTRATLPLQIRGGVCSSEVHLSRLETTVELGAEADMSIPKCVFPLPNSRGQEDREPAPPEGLASEERRPAPSRGPEGTDCGSQAEELGLVQTVANGPEGLRKPAAQDWPTLAIAAISPTL